MSLTREQSIKDCLTLWRYMAQTGKEKYEAVKILFNRGQLSQEKYSFDCPLCEFFNDTDRPAPSCPDCPWPGKGAIRCILKPGPYGKYYNLLNNPCADHYEIRSQCSRVYQFLKEHLSKEVI